MTEPKIKKIYSLTSLQEGMLFHSLYDGKSAYFEQIAANMHGDINQELFRKSLSILFERYDILRTIFLFEELEQCYQIVLEEREPEIGFFDISDKNKEEQIAYIDEFKKRDIEKGFDLSSDVLMRVNVIKTEPFSYVVIWSSHHIIMDGWCISILMKDFLKIYSSLRKGKVPSLGAVKQFSEYMEWLEARDTERAKEYWDEFLKGYSKKTGIPENKAGDDWQKYEQKVYSFAINEDMTQRLDIIGKENALTLNTLLQTAWGILLQKYNQTEDVVFGSVVSGRPSEIEGIEEMVGLFINTIPVRIKKEKGQSFISLAKAVQQSAAESKEFEYYSLAKIQSEREYGKDMVNHIFLLENYPVEGEIETEDKTEKDSISFSNIKSDEHPNYNYNLMFVPGKKITVNIAYNDFVYTESFIEKSAGHLLKIIDDVIKDVNMDIDKIDILTTEERKQVLCDFNCTESKYPSDKTISQLFEEQAQKTPKHIAVEFEGSYLTYEQLKGKADALAMLLIQKGITTENVVAIMMERSLEMAIAFLGVLKAGAAYVPIAVDYPIERVEYILKDCQAKVLLVSSDFKSKLGCDIEICPIDRNRLFECDTMMSENSCKPENLAYIIYTSGTTGNPKGIMVEHRSVVNYIYSRIKQYKLEPSDVTLQLAAYFFDGFGSTFYSSLLSGGKLVLLHEDKWRDFFYVKDVIKEKGITFLSVAPAMYKGILHDAEYEDLKSVRLVVLAADRADKELIESSRRINKNIFLVNEYGPTETTIAAVVHEGLDSQNITNIGKPIANNQIYIVDNNLKPVPMGIMGEICISGAGVSRGYLNNDKLTAEKFIPNPFASGKFMYKTGDMGKWHENGNIEFLGRMDNQVKIRGFRVELEEIEKKLLMHQAIEEAVVIDRNYEDGTKYLCAYFVSSNEVNNSELREFLAATLPYYMIPSYFVKMDELPMISNVKVDRKALPEPTYYQDQAIYQAPQGEIEEKLAVVWQEVLGVQKVGRMDNFFDLGGDSIKAIQLSARFRRYGMQFEIKDLFKNPYIKMLAPYVKVSNKKSDQGTVDGFARLIPIQQWFFELNFKNPHHFNQSIVLHRNEGFDEIALEEALKKLAIHHDALRTVYTKESGELKQYIRGTDVELVDFQVIDFTGEKECKSKIEAFAQEMQRSIDCEKGPLFKVAQFKTIEGDVLLLIVHHLVVDGVSWAVLIEDITEGYKQALNHQDIKLPDKTDSFIKWGEKLYEYANSSEILKEVEFWKKQEEINVKPLPKDNIVDKRSFASAERVSIQLDEEDTWELLNRVNSFYSTEINDILLTALAMAIKSWTGQEQVAVWVEGHGREEIIPDVNIQRTVGWFTSMYPIILEILGLSDVAQQVQSVKEQLLRIPNKGIGYGLLKYMTDAGHEAAMSFKQNPEICFNYLGQLNSHESSETLQWSDINAGHDLDMNENRPNPININSMVKDNKFRIDIQFDKYEFNKDTMEKFLNSYIMYLGSIIKHCKYKGTQEWIEKIQNINFETDNFAKAYPLSNMQQGMYFHWLYEKSATAYFQQLSLHVGEHIDVEVLTKSMEVLIERYEIFRTVFVNQELESPLQVVLKEMKPQIHNEDIMHLNEAEKELYLDSFLEKDRNAGFDLNKGPLIRLAVLKTGKECCQLVFSFHHIIMDGWCIATITQEFFQIYRAIQANNQYKLKKVTPYSEYIAWLEKQDMEAGRNYWRAYLEGYEQTPPLRSYTNKKNSNKYEQGRLSLEISETLTEGLENIARKNWITMNTLLETAWGVLLQRYNNSDNVVFGSVVSGRPPEISGIEDMVGLFINTIPVRIQSSKMQRFTELLKECQEKSLSSTQYHYCSLAEIQACTAQKQDLIDHVLVFENYPVEKAIEGNQGADGFKVGGAKTFEQTSYALTLNIKSGKRIEIDLNYDKGVFTDSNIRKISQHLKKILLEISKKPDILVEEIDLITDEEKNEIFNCFNNTAQEYPSHKTIHQLFEEQVGRTPDKTAVIFNGESMTYLQLNKRATQLAKKLRDKEVTRDSIVGIMAERSFEMLVGIFGIIKAGGAYMPISPDYPDERIEYMLKDSNAPILLTQEKYKNHIFNIETIVLEDESIYEGDSIELQNINTSQDMAYVIYTSGSTGKPKGVVIEHRSLVNRINWMQKSYPIGIKDTILQKTTYTFDVSVWEIFWWSVTGGAVCLLNPGEEKEPSKIIEAVKENNVTVMHFVPSMLSAFLEYTEGMERANNLKSLRRVFASGEALTLSQVSEFNRLIKINGTSLHNLYGPTEATIDVTYYDCEELEENSIIPIGKPIDNTKMYIFDKNMKLVPVGVTGELYIAGDGLARGYLGQSELTKERFIPNPYLTVERMYRSGDLARWLEDGNIEFLGRVDSQVKIRGFRIELAEIESCILKFNEIRDTAVIARDEKDNTKCLCAYISADKKISESELRAHIKKLLPDYMAPTYFVQLERLPLSANGKVDRKTLAKTTLTELDGSIATGVQYEAPRNSTEEKLTAIWREILRVEHIGINDNFFELGGHSLKATSLAAKIHKVLNVEIPLKEIFKSPTIKEISEYIKNSAESIYSQIQPVGEEESNESSCYEMSSAQKRIYTLQQLELDSTSYNMPGVLELDGALDTARLKTVFSKLIQRHEALRTSFEVAEELMQRVHKNVQFDIEIYDEADDKAIEGIVKNFIRPFDLSQAPLLRVGLIKVSLYKHILMFDMQHIISDGISMGILVEEFSRLYAGEELTPLRIQYKDFSEWQNELLRSVRIKAQEEYWLKQFEGEIPVLNLPTDYQRPVMQSFEGDFIGFTIDKELTNKLRQIAKDTGSTMYMVLLSTFNILLSKHSAQEDIVIGSPIAGRPHADLENIIGMFVNTLAMRNYPSGEKSYREFLREVKENALEAYENQDYQFEELVEKLNIVRDFSRNPLFDVMFTLQNTDVKEATVEGLKITPYKSDNMISKFDITMNVVEQEDSISIRMQYCTKLFSNTTIERICKCLENIIQAVTENIDAKLSEIDILTKKERQQILIDFNNTKIDYPKNKTIKQLFEEQVERTPDNIAVVYEDECITYSELNERANQLARVLKNKGVKSDSIIAIMVERSLDMIVGIMGILKAGGAYLPIDSEYPQDRIEYILQDSGAGILLSQGILADKITYNGSIIKLDEESLYQGDFSNLETVSKPSDLVYVIYTSGTTGKPKGVMLENNSLINYVSWFTNMTEISKADKSVLLSSYAFDLGYTALYSAILKGAELHIVSKEIYSMPEKLISYINHNKISYIKLTPSLYNTICSTESFLTGSGLASLRLIVLGGEEINAADVEKTYKLYSQIKVMNHYGPTETTVGTAGFIIDHDKLEYFKDHPVIGKPINNSKIYIVDKYSNLTPVMIAGELCVVGEGLARGYLNRPELTSEKFADSPFESGTRIYRTGDLARWLPDGNIEFLGRIDHQVKIRGYRVELGEIENKLLSHEAIKDIVVIAKDDNSGSKYLCAYVVGEKELTVLELRGYLSQYLPDYMIPSYFIQLEKLPLTSNGKLDRKALPEPTGNISTGAEYEAPRNSTEEKLVAIWSEVLRVEGIGINDNFFELGGHSLKATSLAAKIHKGLNVEIPLKEIFKKPTIKGISEYIKVSEESIYSQIQPIEEKDYYEMSSAQKRMYTLQQFDGDSTSYNMPRVLELEGDLDAARLKEVFNKLIRRHEALRTSFEVIDEKLVQKVHEEVEFDIEVYEANKDIEGIIKSFIRVFDLSKAPLLRVGLVELEHPKSEANADNKQKHYLLMVDMYHIICDGVSMGILMKEFSRIYAGEELTSLRIQYKDFSEWQNKLFKSEKIKAQEQYWLKQFKGEIPVLNLLTDYQRPIIQSFEGASIQFEIETALTNKLRQIAKATSSTMYMVLLSTLNILLSKYSGQEDIVVGSPIAGRPHADLENIIGMFVNTLAIRNYPKGEKTFREFLREVKENALEAYANQDYQFEELVGKLNITRDFSRNPLFDVMLVLQNTAIDKLEADHLKVNSYKAENRISKFDITINAVELKNSIGINIEYCTKLFSNTTIERMYKHLENIMLEITEDIDIKLSEVQLLTEAERHQILMDFNNTKIDYPKNMTVHQLFEEQVAKTPDNIAVVYQEESLTYRELNKRATQLARVLSNKGISSDSIFAIMVESSLEMVIGIMGIIKAGYAYLPIDSKYPQDRIEYMLEDSGAVMLLTQKHLAGTISFTGEVILLEDELLYQDKEVEICKKDNLVESLAYVIYTSGSKGKPKGVMIEQHSLVNMCMWYVDYYQISETDRTTKYAGFGFDASVWEIFPYLIAGSSIYIIEEEIKLDVQKLNEYYEANRITISFLPTQIYEQFMMLDNKSLRCVLTGGDKLKQYRNTEYRVVNNYGPTENTIVATSFELDKEYDNIPIGKPVSNTQVYIVDKYNILQPIGVAGELCIAGEGLARGYLNKQELTIEKFVENPFKAYSEAELETRMYRTGDLARWLPDGNIEFLGRIDHQVKLRGFRIELGEIEAQLLCCEGIRETAVIDIEDGQGSKYLCAYVVSEREIQPKELREKLSAKLPEYMLPSYYIQLESLPLTANGKLDRKALIKLETPRSQNLNMDYYEYEAPRNEIEKRLADIFEEVLGVAKAGIRDSFFSLGGDSIKAIQASARLRKYGLKLNTGDIFRNPRIAELAKCITKEERKISQATVLGEVELIPIQKWFFEKSFTNEHHWNQAVMLYRKECFDEELVAKVFTKITEHHDNLRSIFQETDTGMVKQIIKAPMENSFSLETISFQGESNYEIQISEAADRLQGSINLAEGPLVKLGLFKTGAGDHLLIAIHHLVVDGVSWRIILEDFAVAYKQITAGGTVVLQEKTDSFRDWAVSLKKYSDSTMLLKEKDYWRRLENMKVAAIKPEFEGGKSTVADGAIVTLQLSEEDTDRLLHNVNQAYNTEINDILMTALGLAFKEWTADERLLVNLEGHGREEILGDINITRTVGWFTSTYPVVLDMTGIPDVAWQIKNIKETLRHIPSKGMGYGILSYMTSEDNKADLDFSLKPQISFNYLGQFDQDVDTGLFTVSSISSGRSISPASERMYSIGINGAIARGCLGMSFSYSTKEYSEESISELKEAYSKNLIALIRHCIEKTKEELTPSDTSAKNLSLAEFEELMDNLSFDRADIKDIYGLSPMQHGMLYHLLLDNESRAYFEQMTFSVRGSLDMQLFEKSLNWLIERHDVLRTVFIYQNAGQPMQAVLKHRQAELYFEDISSMSEMEKQIYLTSFKEKDGERGFDLSKDILIRASVFKVSSDGYVMIWSFHHILMDGWCLSIVMNDFFKAYSDLSAGKEPEREKTFFYSGFIRWLEEQDKDEAALFWKKYLEGYEEQAVLPGKNTEALVSGYQQRQVSFKLSQELTEKMTVLARQMDSTLSTIFQGIWGTLLQRYNNTTDVVFGKVISGRPSEIEGIETMIGLFINTVPVRVRAGISFEETIRTLQRDALESEHYGYLPLADIQSYSGLRQKLFDHIVVFENYPLEKELEDSTGQKAEISIENAEVFEQTNYNFEVIASPGNELSVKLKFNALVYDEEFIKNIASHFIRLAEAMVNQPKIKSMEAELLTELEKQFILEGFNNTKSDYPKDRTIHQLFEEQVERTPDNIAVVCEDKSLSYRELNEKANQLARVLRHRGVFEDKIVGLRAERSLELIVGIMGVLKAGGAYLPIDPEYPQDRIEYMLQDSGARILLTQKHLKDSVIFDGEVICVDEEGLYVGKESNLELACKPSSLAYVIYTSGSTGKPKGVMLEHRGVVNYIHWAKKNYQKGENLDCPLYTSISFDLTVTSIYTPLITGSKVVIYGKETGQLLIQDILQKNEVELIKLTPAHLSIIKDLDNSRSNIKRIIVGGEQLDTTLTKKVYNSFSKGVEIYNEYGPTEASVGCMLYKFDIDKDKRASVPIGVPADNTKIYIVDKNDKLQPIGVAGELCIAGDGLARGYLNRPELTEKVFVQNPFEPNTRMYRTGDLARLLLDGNIEFLGRIDNQVKIRGYRIELGEIENKLLSYTAINEAVVIAKADNSENKYLCAYIVVQKELTVREIREHLAQNLPDYMIPSYFIQLDKLPLTSNGKIDRKALPEPDGNIFTGAEYEAPRNSVEEKLAEIWQDILKAEKISINDSFFELGGHSLKATILTSRIHKEFGVELPLKEIFKASTIKEQAQLINESEESIYYSIQPIGEREYYALSSAQKRMYVLQQFDKHSTSYNVPLVMKIEGQLDTACLEAAFEKLVKRHEAFRTGFEMLDGVPVQKVYSEVKFAIEYMEAENEQQGQAMVKALIRPFDLSKAPLLRVGLVELKHAESEANDDKVKHQQYLLMVDMNHIISDAISMNILIKEFVELYKGNTLEPLRIQYKDYSEWQNELLMSEKIEQQKQYWQERFAGDIFALDIVRDYPRPMIQSFEGDHISFELYEALTTRLKDICQETGATLYMVLLAAYNILLSKYSGQEDIIVGSPIAGRPHTDLENIIGIFINTLAMRNFPTGEKTFGEFLREVKENALEAYENQDYQFEELVENLNITRDMSRNPLFDVMFTIQNIDNPDTGIDTLKVNPYPMENKTSKFDMTLTAVEKGTNIGLTIEYCTRLFRKETIERLISHYNYILLSITDNMQIKLRDIEMLKQEEICNMLTCFNNTAADYPKDKTINELFEQQATETPDSIALIYGDASMSYRELNEKSNRLARLLRQKGVVADSIVAILTERSMDMVIGIMAILKAWGAYLPIDPAYPEERISYILEDSGSRILLIQNTLKEKVNFVGETLYLEDESLYTGSGENLKPEAKPNNLAYIIYTSGTTGNPKGVMLEHKSVVNTLWAMQECYPIYKEDAFLLKTTYTFDVSVTELFGWFFGGGRLIILEQGAEKDPQQILKTVRDKKVTHMNFVPSMLNVFMSIIEEAGIAHTGSLRYIFAAGEALPKELVNRFTTIANNTVQLANIYGPTEAAIYATRYSLENVKSHNTVPIGKPIANMRAYILDSNDKPQPVGVPGELCLTGVGLARGYLGKPELTAQKFVPNPWETNETMYRTGDLAMWLPDGNIEFLGRIDNQVKIRGYRIELDEIEGQLLNYEYISEATVTVSEDESGDKYLCAYISGNSELEVSDIREYLSKQLPEYMVPSFILQVDEIPRTTSGKVDKKRLPDARKAIITELEYVVPQKEIEKQIASIWEEVLGIPKIGINYNFFDLGGNSLKLLQMHAKIEKLYPGKLYMTDIFASPTVKKLAVIIESHMQSNIKLECLLLPDEYFEKGSKNSISLDLNFEIEKSICESLESIAQKEAVRLDYIFAALFSYLLCDISGCENIHVQTMVEKNNLVIPMSMMTDNISTIAELFISCTAAMEEGIVKGGYNLDMAESISPAKEENAVLPMLYHEKLMKYQDNLSSIYDILFGYSINNGSITFRLKFSSRIKSEKARELADKFAQLIELTIDEYKFD